jgi:hypothetical protein
VSSVPQIDWSQVEITDPGHTLRVPVLGATPEWCDAFKAEAELQRHLAFQQAWGDIGLIGVTIFVPSVPPANRDALRRTLEELVATAQRRVATAPRQQSPQEMLELMRTLAG